MRFIFKKYVWIDVDLEVGEQIKVEGWGHQFDGKTVTIQGFKPNFGGCESGVMMKVSGYDSFIDVGWATKLPASNSGEVSEGYKSNAINFHNWLAEEGYEFTEVRYRMYLGGKYYWITDLYDKYSQFKKD